ncbi:MAG TPA: FAD-binding oxidoreductase [Bacillales bacterium]
MLIYCIGFIASLWGYHQKPLIITDKGRLLPTKIKAIHAADDSADLQQWIKKVAVNHEKISIAGMQHSQGGHTLYPGGIMLDMRDYDEIIAYHPKEKMITVQSGATWADIQKEINPDGLAVRVMQSQNIFTVGGSISVNAHGRDIRYGSLMSTVKSFRLLTADGEILNVSRTENNDLFPLVLGGYGLFGIILDVTLELTDDELYQIRFKEMDYEDYPDYFRHKVKQNPKARMHIARISVAPESFLQEMYVKDYVLADNQKLRPEYSDLDREWFVAAPKFFLGLSRYSEWGKDLLWNWQKRYFQYQDDNYITRNNVMRSDSKFLEYHNPNRTETLQEYYVPVDEFVSYIDDLRDLLEEEDLNLLNITVRYVGYDEEEPVLTYTHGEDMFALVLLMNQELGNKATKQTTEVVRKMIDLTLAHGGSYYLPYYSYPSQQQFEKAYPRNDVFFKKKRRYDPHEVFMNLFYKEYGP